MTTDSMLAQAAGLLRHSGIHWNPQLLLVLPIIQDVIYVRDLWRSDVAACLR